MQRSVENELLGAIRRLEKRVDEQNAVIAERDKRIAELEGELAKLKKDSSTSSKPPSSDVVKPPRGGTNGGTFAGSGSQLIGAERLRRRARAIEISPAFVDGSIRRWEKATGKEAVLDGTAKTFAEVARERGVAPEEGT